jgi:hypothetical protein
MGGMKTLYILILAYSCLAFVCVDRSRNDFDVEVDTTFNVDIHCDTVLRENFWVTGLETEFTVDPDYSIDSTLSIKDIGESWVLLEIRDVNGVLVYKSRFRVFTPFSVSLVNKLDLPPGQYFVRSSVLSRKAVRENVFKSFIKRD